MSGSDPFDDPTTAHIAAPAKINLYLRVIGKRADGYHLLDSLIGFTELHDTISAAVDESLSLKTIGPFAGQLTQERNNLVLKAARLLAAAAGIKARARLRLIKRLPVTAGIGGGSADAAATLRALNDLWGVKIADSELAALGLDLGADVPVCLRGRPTLVGGVGEDLTDGPDMPEIPIVLVNPRKALSTPAVFKARKSPFSRPFTLTGNFNDVAAVVSAIGQAGNDLTDAAVSKCPQIANLLAGLEDQDGCLLARMSGSGATCFALFGSTKEAQNAAAAITEANPRLWVRATKLLPTARALAPDLSLD